ncbi:MAG: M1 family metallopeptidase, partial [Rhodothermales bacterium]|nr:M1 family metallopeptidase [Rhodothermales bacterium]
MVHPKRTQTRHAIAAIVAVAAVSVGYGAYGQDLHVIHNLPLAKANVVAGEVLPAKTGATESFDAHYYHLDLDIDFDSERIAGTTRVVGAFSVAESILSLDLDSVLEVVAVRETGSTGLAFDHSDNVLSIDLGRVASPGEQVDVEVDYGGQPQASGFGAFAFGSVDDMPVAWTLSEPYGARAWWPGKDHPSDKADSARITVKVPSQLRVGSNGVLVSSEESDGRTTYDWVVSYPIAPYLISLAAAPYTVFEQTYVRPDSLVETLGPLSLPVVHYKYPGRDGTVLPPGWAEVLDALAVFEWWFGPYPFPEEKYGHAEFGWRGGVEHQTLSSMGGTSVALVTHELAHQWFGDAVTTRTWPHLWLNEGFASYAEIIYWEAMSDRFPGAAESSLRSDQQRARAAVGTLVVEDTLDVGNLFAGSRVYGKGSVVLHMLRHVIGDDAFRTTLKAYLEDPALAYGTAVTADFQRVAEEVSGRDLDVFFRQWVTEGTGYPRYDVSYAYGTSADAGYDLHIRVRQTQTAIESTVQVFQMPITVEVTTNSGEQRFVFDNTERDQVFTVRTDEPPTAVRFDPDGIILSNDPLVLDEGPIPAPTENSFELAPNPSRGFVHLSGVVASSGRATVDVADA